MGTVNLGKVSANIGSARAASTNIGPRQRRLALRGRSPPSIRLQERLAFIVLSRDRGVWFRRAVAESETTIVEDLENQNNVGQGVVDGQYDHGGQNTLKDGAQDVEDIADKPDDDECD